MTEMGKLQRGDLLVFDEIFQKFHTPLYNYVFNRTGSAYYADEVVQLTFIKLWKYRASLSPNHTISTQIFRIAQTVLIDELRKLQTKSKAKYAYFSQSASCTEHNESSQNLEYQELQNKLNAAINNMPPIRRKVFTLSRFNSLSSKEISRQLSISPKTVDNHIHLALKQIKSIFSISLWLILVILNF